MKTLVKIVLAIASLSLAFHSSKGQSLFDDFSGDALDSTLWDSRTPYCDSTLSVASGNVSLLNGSGVLSMTNFPHPIEVSFRFAFVGSDHDSFRVLTRADAFRPNGYGVANGVGVSFRIQEDTGNTMNNISLEDYNGTIFASATIPLAIATFYSFRLVDTGTSLSLFAGSQTTPILTAATSVQYGTKIASFNREGACAGSTISAGSKIAIDYIRVCPCCTNTAERGLSEDTRQCGCF